VIGTFDKLDLPKHSLDFVVAIDSLHHSDDLACTMAECSRVLKPGGIALLFDRCQPNELSDEQIEAMVSRQYSRDFLAASAYPTDIILTRRDNGEHEYRLFEWCSAIDAAGLRLTKRCELHRRIEPRSALKGLMSVLPRRLTSAIYQTPDATPKTTAHWIVQQIESCIPHGRAKNCLLAPKRTTALLLTKPR
jgi:SAM-dependent methyltransferase